MTLDMHRLPASEAAHPAAAVCTPFLSKGSPKLCVCSGLANSECLSKIVLDHVDLGMSGWAAVLGALRDNHSITALK